MDAPVLADFIRPARMGPVVEIGGGCGIISLLLLWKGVVSRLTVFEIQPFYARLSRINARMNGMGNQMKVVCGDYLASDSHHAPAELIFANPPFYPPGKGRISLNAEIAQAKWELRLSMGSLLSVSRQRLKSDGRLAMILPARRELEYRRYFIDHGFWIERYRPVRAAVDGKDERFLVQLTTGHAVEERLEPLVLFSSPGEYSTEMSAILKGL